MAQSWTSEQVEALSPDASSLKAAQKLLNKAKWPSLGVNPQALWGECQGSGKKPYLTRIDLSEPAFKCSCPSRKFPCKHSLALFLLYTEDTTAFTQDAAPDWVTEWLDSRASRKDAKAKKTTAPVDEKAQEKRIAAREKKVLSGLIELELWMHDLLRTGLMQLPSKPSKFLEDMAARLIDAQAAGLARLVRELDNISFSKATWAEDATAKLGNLQIIIDAYKRQDTLPENVRADLRRVVGWTDNQKDLLTQSGTHDDWLVLAQRQSHEDNLRIRHSWLWGQESQKIALDLQFAYGSQAFQNNLVIGQVFTGELVFFPSQHPQRAALKAIEDSALKGQLTNQDLARLNHTSSFDSLLEDYAHALASNCWLESFPVLLSNILPCMFDAELVLKDSNGLTLPVSQAFKQAWQLMAVSGGEPVKLVAEWNGQTLRPLSVFTNELISLEGVS